MERGGGVGNIDIFVVVLVCALVFFKIYLSKMYHSAFCELKFELFPGACSPLV